MVLQKLYWRSIHRKSLLSRQGAALPDDDLPIGTSRPAPGGSSSTSSSTPPRASSTSTTPSTSSTPSAVSTSTTPSATSTRTSSTSAAAATTTPARETGVLTTASRTLTTTSSIRTSSRSLTATPSTTTDDSPAQTADSTGSNAGSLVGVIGGVMIGILILVLTIFYFVRRYKRKKEEEEAFSAAEFRKSAVMLDDDAINAVPSRNPRPPTMIERHVAHAPPMGGYQYDQGPYQGGNARPYPDQGFGGPMPNYGPPGGYGYAVQEPQYPQHQQYQYGHQQPMHHAPVEGLPNPFVSPMEGAPPAIGFDARSSAPGTPVLSRQASMPGGPMDNGGQYVEMSRDAGGPPTDPSLPAALVAGGSTGAAPSTLRNKPAGGDQPRPLSAHTTYDPEDAYGGM